jgi:hypothetical protein
MGMLVHIKTSGLSQQLQIHFDITQYRWHWMVVPTCHVFRPATYRYTLQLYRFRSYNTDDTTLPHTYPCYSWYN